MFNSEAVKNMAYKYTTYASSFRVCCCGLGISIRHSLHSAGNLPEKGSSAHLWYQMKGKQDQRHQSPTEARPQVPQ